MTRRFGARIARKVVSLSRAAGAKLMPERVPQAQLRYRMNQLQKVEFALRRVGASFGTASSILDFGCGTGRLTVHMAALAPQARITGCDVVAEQMARARARVPRGRFVVNRWCPPLEFEDAAFDLIFSYSVFTHLSEANHRDWLKELTRVLRPGGVMAHSIHSPASVARMTMFSPESLPKYALRAGPVGYHYAVDNPATPEYGETIISKDYVLDVWPRVSGLRVVEFEEGAIESYPEGCHDLVVLKK